MTRVSRAAPPTHGWIEVRATCILGAPAATVWAVVGDFGGIAAWLPGIEAVTLEGRGVGAIRVCRTSFGIFRERLTAAQRHSCRYVIDAGPVPVRDYEATLAVEPWAGGTHCRVVWASSFAAVDVDDAEARRRIERIYAAGFGALRVRFGASAGRDDALDNADG
jgi:uncharacterized protein YndB with AHSA1/START domain